jgi:hypothetical protein
MTALERDKVREKARELRTALMEWKEACKKKGQWDNVLEQLYQNKIAQCDKIEYLMDAVRNRENLSKIY